MNPVDLVLEELAAHGSEAREVRGGWVAVCPAHEDRRPSLHISEGADGRVLLLCRAGCATADVLDQIGLSMRDLFARAA